MLDPMTNPIIIAKLLSCKYDFFPEINALKIVYAPRITIRSIVLSYIARSSTTLLMSSVFRESAIMSY